MNIHLCTNFIKKSIFFTYYIQPKLGNPLEFCSAISLLVITHHDSYKYAFKTFPFQRVAVVVFLVTERCGEFHKLVFVRIRRLS